MQNQIHKNKNFKHKYNFQSCFTFEPGKLIQAKSNIANILPKKAYPDSFNKLSKLKTKSDQKTIKK